MTTSSAVTFQVVGTPRRRVVRVSPGARPDLRVPLARPARPVSPGGASHVTSCRVGRPEQRSPWLLVKVALVAFLAVVGGAVSAVELVSSAVAPDPAVGYVAGDPAWAHVTQP